MSTVLRINLKLTLKWLLVVQFAKDFKPNGSHPLLELLVFLLLFLVPILPGMRRTSIQCSVLRLCHIAHTVDSFRHEGSPSSKRELVHVCSCFED